MASSSNLNSSRHNPTDQQDLQSSGHVRWFILQGTDQSQPVSKLSPFVIDKALRAAAGDLKTVKRLQKGDLLLEASSSTQSRCLQHLTHLGDCPVSVTPHRTLNSCKGVIRCRDLVDCDKDEILSELSNQHVTDIHNITVPNDSGGRRHYDSEET